MPTAEELRRVAEEVRLAFPRPLRAPQLVLIDVDPCHLHAFWTLEPAAVDAARRALGADGDMVLRIAEAVDGPETHAFDVEVVGLQGQCYVDVWGEQRSYRAEIALRSSDGRLTSLTPTAWAQLPSTAPGAPSPTPPPAPPMHPADPTAATPAGEVVPPMRPMPAAHELPEPVRHPFPLPPTEAGAYDPEPRAPMPAASPTEPAPPPAAAARPMPAAHELPEPVRHPFPLPPTEASEYIPDGLLGGFAPADTPLPGEPVSAAQMSDVPAEAASAADGEPAGQAPASGDAGAAPPSQAHDPADLLPLENVLTLSSFALGHQSVEFEINAELHITGRVRPGMRLQLFGRPVALRPDGSFSITRPLPAGALLFSSLIISDDPTP